MNELDIHLLMVRRFKKPGTHVEYSQRPNLVKDLNESHSIWYVDITYIELNPGKWVYLSTVLEEHSSKMLAYKISTSMTSDLVTETMLIILKHHPKSEYLHSYMGSQYDNSLIEAFHSLLKREFVLLNRFTSYDDLVLRTSNYIH